jgi:hypothetical protein
LNSLRNKTDSFLDNDLPLAKLKKEFKEKKGLNDKINKTLIP